MMGASQPTNKITRVADRTHPIEGFGFIIIPHSPTTSSPMRYFLLAFLLVNLATLHSVRAQDQPDCDYCKGKMLTLDNLRKSLPPDWLLQMEHEPVFDSDVLTVQAGMDHPQTLLLVHGLGQNGFTDWMSVMPQLARRYHVLTLDLPGFGYSDSPSGKYSPSNYARVLSWLLKKYGEGPAIVVGHSLGGAVALRFASEHPDQLSKLVLVDAAGILQRTAFVKQPASLPISIEKTPAFLKGAVARIDDWGDNVVEKITGLPDITRTFSSHEDIWGMVMSDHTNLNAGMAMAEENFSEAIYTIKTPTQIIWGEDDPIAPLRTGQMLARRLHRAELHILPGVGHTPMENPDDAKAFLAVLDAALDNDPQPARYAAYSPTAKTDLHCDDKVDRKYSGNYRKVVIQNCSAVKLEDLSAEQVVIRNSIVEMTNVQIHARDLALDVSNSDVVATAGEISGDTDVRADNSRIDMAGFKLSALEHAVEVLSSSRLIGSANEISSPDYNGYWQGNQHVRNTELFGSSISVAIPR
jgi:pimeloyl-ACP methyl ester carboxylesterase